LPQGQAWLVSILAAVVPTIVYVLVLWWLDRYEQEPRRLLLATFVWGAAPAILLSILAEGALEVPLGSVVGGAAEVVSSSIAAPAVEELFKGLALLSLFLLFRREFDDVLDGIIYGATVGFGFAMTENFLYFLGSSQEVGPEGLTLLIVLRSFVFGLNHALFSSVFGGMLGYARAAKVGCKRWIAPGVGLCGAALLHGVHNLFASLASVTCFSLSISVLSNWSGIAVWFAVMVLAWRQEKRWIAEHLQAEVASGLLSPQDYEMIGSYRKRLAARYRALVTGGLQEARRLGRLAQLSTDLAFKIEQGDQATAFLLRNQIKNVQMSSPPGRSSQTMGDHERSGNDG